MVLSKKGAETGVQNMMPISILTNVSKVIEKNVHHQKLVEYL